jgi:hypothetical protein
MIRLEAGLVPPLCCVRQTLVCRRRLLRDNDERTSETSDKLKFVGLFLLRG